MKFKFIQNEGLESVTVIQDGDVLNANSKSHANFNSIKDAILLAHSDEENVDPGIFDLQTAVSQNFEKVSDRFSVRDGVIYVDLEPMNNALSDHVLRALNDGSDFEPLVKFYDNIEANPNEHSREQLFNWLAAHEFTINSEGFILGYKGVSGEVDADEWRSISSGRAFVNGVEHVGTIPQTTGDVVEMPRTDVAHDPNVACHTGLHVGTWDYASGFSRGTVLEVIVNPRDVVSVPSDCGAQKMRTCRYVVGNALDAPYSSAVQVDHEEFDEYDDNFWDEDEEDFGTKDIGDVDVQGSVTGPHYHFNVWTTDPKTSSSSNVVDVTKSQRVTDNNYKSLKRGPGGRFLPKGS